MLLELPERKVEIVKSFNESHKGLKGKIIKETLNMIYLEIKGEVKSFEKSILLLRDSQTNELIDGSRIKNIYERASLYHE